MPYIKAVNEQLETFSTKHDAIEYFDATSLFVDDVSFGHPSFKTGMFVDGIHLSKEGHKVWASAVSNKVKTIVAQIDDSVENTEGGYSADDYGAAADDDWDYGGENTEDEYTDDFVWPYGDDF
jgi:hypothetical protein